MTDPKLSDPKLSEGRVIFAFAHDLRGLLRTVLTRVQMVQASSTAVLDEQDQFFLDEAATAASEINQLLSVMVSYFNVTPAAETTGLRLLLRGLLLELRPVLAEADASLAIEDNLGLAPGKDLQAPRYLSQILKELITNACRFRVLDRKLEIKILLRLQDQSDSSGNRALLVTVADNGPGVPPEWREKIFLPFQRMHPRSEYPGFGVGLALCRKIAETNGGSMGAAASESGGLAVYTGLPVRDLL